MDFLLDYFPSLTQLQLDQYKSLPALYQSWNAKINVISRKDIEELPTRHVLHSLAIAKFISFKPGSYVLDVGTGGGFPGVPLAIFFPEVQFHLVDSIAKKLKVIDAVSTEIGLRNITTEHTRAEKVKSKFDFIITRAVAPALKLYQWSHRSIKTENRNSFDNGIICLKGGDLSGEMKELRRPYQQQSVADYFDDPFFETKKIIYIPL